MVIADLLKYLEAIFCVCVIFTNPFTSIVEKHMQWKVLFLEFSYKVTY